MHNRRTFLLKGGAGLLGLFIPEVLSAGHPLPETPKIDLAGKSWKEIRSHFDLSQDVTFLNNGTMGPSPRMVVERIKQSLDHTNARAVYGGGKKLAKSSLAEFLQVDVKEIALTHNVTEGINISAWGLPLKKGDEIILTDQEHVGNGLPWLHRAKTDKLKVKILRLKPTASETLDALKSLIGPKTKVVAVPHITCTTGQVLPVKEICSLAKKKGVISVIDGAHGTGMIPLNLKDIGCDIYASCCHKWLLGPKGTGYLYVSEPCQDKLMALFVGGYSGLKWSVHKEETYVSAEYTTFAHKYHYGTQDAAPYFGIGTAVDFNTSIGKDRIFKRIKSLNQYLLDGVVELKHSVEILTPQEDESRGGVLSFRFAGINSSNLKKELDKKGIVVRHVAESDLDALRVSTHLYNFEEEIDNLLYELKRLLAN